jgi:hypothetical protein
VLQVDVYVGDTFLRTMPLKLLIRFSITAAETFPKPKELETPKPEAEAEGKGDVDDDVDGEAEDEESDGNVDWSEAGEKVSSKQLAADFKKLAVTPAKKEGEAPETKTDDGTARSKDADTQTEPVKPDQTAQAESSEKAGEAAQAASNIGESSNKSTPRPPNKELHLQREDIWVNPITKAVDHSLDWMQTNSGLSGKSKLIAFHVPKNCNFSSLVNGTDHNSQSPPNTCD